VSVAGTLETASLGMVGSIIAISGTLDVWQSAVFQNGGGLELINGTVVAGSLELLGSTLIGAGAIDAGSIFGDTGSVIDATGGTLTFNGSSLFMEGKIEGDGTVAITGGGVTLQNVQLSVNTLSFSGAGGELLFLASTSYGGNFTLGAGWKLVMDRDGELDLTGTSTLSGTVEGGKLVLLGGTVALDTSFRSRNSNLTVAGADATLGLAVTCIGTFAESSGTINLNGHNLTLRGTETFTGGSVMGAGTVMLKSASTIDGLTLDGGATLSNFAVASENGTVTLGDGSGGFGKIMNQASATFDFVGDGRVTAAVGGSGTFSNLAATSLLEKTGGTGTSLIGVDVANSGEILVSSGTLEIGGNVTGATGTLAINGAATLQFDKSVASGQALTFAGTGGDLVLGMAASFAATIAGFGAGDQLDALHFGVGTTVGFVENGGNTGGTLSITNGASQAQLALLGQYSAAGVGSTSTSQGTVITYTPPPSASDSIASLVPAHG
jgi:hypothetical protein